MSKYCAWCRKHLSGPDIGINAKGVSHGCCPECEREVLGEIAQEIRAGDRAYLYIVTICELRDYLPERIWTKVSRIVYGIGSMTETKIKEMFND